MDSLAILVSGGLDSAILLGDALRQRATVYPIYVRCGLVWEEVEFDYLRRYLSELRRETLRPLTVLTEPVADLYGEHWSVTGRGIPDASTADDAVFLPGRNLLLLTKALLWCHLNHVPELALGSLGTNPFPDASPPFFQDVAGIVNQSVRGSVRVKLPFADMSKAEVMRLGVGLSLEHSFSCINPKSGKHCGKCNKCAERRQAFVSAGMIDPTEYANG